MFTEGPEDETGQLAAIYLRVSTNEQDETNQLKECEDYCKEKGYEIYKVYSDRSSAWKKGNIREGFEDMLKEARRRKFQHIVVWDYDRFYRNRKKFIEVIWNYKKIGVKTHSVNQRYIDDLYRIPEPFNEMMVEFMLNFIGHISQEESDRKSRRVKLAYKNRKKKWGRPSVSKYKVKRTLELREQGLSLRHIGKQVKLGKSTVHKILSENSQIKTKKS